MSRLLSLYAISDRYGHTYPAYVHDHNLTLWAEGRVQSYLHLERHSRRKYDNYLPHYFDSLLESKAFSLTPETEIVMVDSFVGRSMVSRSGRFRVEGSPFVAVGPQPQPAKAYWQQKPWEGYPLKAWHVSHELAHIGSCLPFFGNFRENSLLVHFDGGASEGNFSAFLYREGNLQLLECHWELAQLSKFFNDNALSFALMQAAPGEHTSVPGKLMGYAALGSYREEVAEWLAQHGFFKEIWQDPTPFYAAAKADFSWQGDLRDQRDAFLLDVAAALQGTFERQWLAKLTRLQQQVQAKSLYLSGGCALNILANTRIVESGLFSQVYIPPACNDSGLSLGGAAIVAWQRGEEIPQHSPYLNGFELEPTPEVDHETVREVGDLIAKGGIVGVALGYGEAGPRALGNRSLIARADDPAITRRLSRDCKRREWFRPVAPVMLAHLAEEVCGNPLPHQLTRYMLLDCRVQPTYHQAMAGVLHAGDSARIQTIRSRDEHPFLFDLLTYAHKTYGMLALTNTSFNAQEEPIVHTPEQARTAAQRMGLDATLVQGKLSCFAPPQPRPQPR